MRLFNDNWSFYRSEQDMEVGQIREKLSLFQSVDLPHDWLIYDTENLYRDGIGWYCKRFAAEPGDGKVFLRFDGVYMDSTVYLNGQKVKEWKYGYSTFDADVSDYLAEGENELLVKVCFQSPNSRWYSGAGIYRNVWLKQCSSAYLPFDGTYVTIREQGTSDTPGASGGQDASGSNGMAKGQDASRWQVEISTEAEGWGAGGMRCRYTLLYRGKPAWELGEADVTDGGDDAGDGGNAPGDGRNAAGAGGNASGDGGSGGDIVSRGVARLTACVENPHLWDVEEPECYQLLVELLDGAGRTVDEDRMTVGFRTMEFTTDRGFFLNHRHLKLHGVCEHHDLGCLGAVFHREAMRRKLVILKQMGVNALRTSHNMPAPELMELADEMGIVVVSEAFDMWELPKTKYDYARFFPEWAERDVRSWVRRDRNHPCLLMWSIGNEIYDTHAGEHGQEITRRLMGDVRKHDPRGNAGITIGSNYMPWENAQKCADIVKLAGYNYGDKYYAAHHAEHPDWVIYGSETASIVYSRGVYHFPAAQSCLSEVDEQCSALGNSATSWGAQNIEKLIADDRDCVYSLGQFLWTGFDYIGEPTPYHTKNSYFGQIDTAGFPKDSYYVFQAEWTDAKACPMVHLFPYWDWNEGQMIDVLACTNGDSVELFLNGESRGRQKLDRRNGVLLAGWQVAYEPGELLAVAYDSEGGEIAREARLSFGESAAVALAADKRVLRADGEDLCFVTVSMVDRDGHPVENAMDYVTVHVDGPGRLLGLDNGDSTDYDQYKGSCRKLFNGKLLAVVASTAEAGEICLRVEACADGIAGASLKLAAESAPVREGICCRENCAGQDGQTKRAARRIPLRKLELTAGEERRLTPEKPRTEVRVRLLPENTTDRDVAWEAVNDAGIPLGYVKVTPKGDGHALVEAGGDGAFRVRCLGRDSEGKVHILSQMEFEAAGFGESMTDPYAYVSAGLYARIIGDVAGGNEKGIAFARDGRSGAVYERLDFGEYGSDTITADIFALSDDPYEIELWEGAPGERPDTGDDEDSAARRDGADTGGGADSAARRDGADAGDDGDDGSGQAGRLIARLTYQKPSIWNTYQAETWKLPERLKGVKDLSFVMYDKVHMKGFSFLYLEKAFQRLTGGDCTRVYGDSFRRDGAYIRDIGNNVTVVYEGMDFGEGAENVTIWGHTPLAGNTIHLLFTGDGGTEKRIIVEFPGGGREEFRAHRFPVEGFRGKGKLELVFLPGSDFSLEALQFGRGGEADGPQAVG